MRSGTPIIASDVGAISEIILDGVNGKLIWNPLNFNSFVFEINNFYNKIYSWNDYSLNCKIISKLLMEKSNKLNINKIYDLFNK